MGADIHGVWQYKIGDHWFTQGEIPDDRNYALFGALAGVRNYQNITPIAEPRGLPFNFPVKDEYFESYRGKIWMGDHSYSWLTLDEMLSWDGWSQLDGAETIWLKWLDYAKAASGGYESRIVFGFDS